MGDSRLQLVLEANDQASAVLAKVRDQIKATGVEANTASGHIARTADGLDRIGGGEVSVHKATHAMSSLSFAASEARLGTEGAVMAVGTLATTALEMAPALAEWAIPIGAVVALLGTVVSLMGDTRSETDRIANFQTYLGKQTLTGLQNAYAGAQAQREQALKDIEETTDTFWDRMLHKRTYARTDMGALARDIAYSFGGANPDKQSNMKVADENSVNAFKALQDAKKQDDLRLITMRDQSSEMIRQKAITLESARATLAVLNQTGTQLNAQTAAARAQLASQNASVTVMFRHRDAAGNLVALTREEVAERNQLLGLNQAAYKVALQEVQLREIQRGQDARFQANTQLALLQAQARDASAPQMQNLQAQIAYQQKLVEISRAGYAPELAKYLQDQAFAAYDAARAITALQVSIANAQLKSDVDQNASDPMEVYRGRMEAILAARDAEIRAGNDRVLVEQRTQQQIRALQRDTVTQAKANYKSLEDVLVASKSREVHGVGEAMRSVRKVLLGYEAAEATVNALKYGAKAIGYAADNKWGQAAMAASAALQFAKVAAVAGQESLGGGSSSSGGGSTTQASSFEPRNATAGNGGVTVNLITRDPYGRDSIQTAMYEINRAGALGVPAIAIPSTTGVRRTA